MKRRQTGITKPGVSFATEAQTAGLTSAGSRGSLQTRKSQTELRIFDAFRDPQGVAARPLTHVVAEEITHGASKAKSAATSNETVPSSSSSTSSSGAVRPAGPVVFAFKQPLKPSSEKPSRTLRDALLKLCQPQNSSSAAYLASHLAAMRGPPVLASSSSSASSSASHIPLSKKAKKALTLRRRADDARVQQLRGIFAGHDSDRDGYLGEE
jgi:hypothetical protein